MRKDEAGNEIPETLGEYREWCQVIGLAGNQAVRLLDEAIGRSRDGAGTIAAPDEHMRAMLMPWLATPALPPKVR